MSNTDSRFNSIIKKLRKDLLGLPKFALSRDLAKNNLKMYVKEGIVVYPEYEIMKAFADFYKFNRFLGVTPEEMDEYISLTRFAEGRDKAYCDWCGIANGSLELFSKKLREYFLRYNEEEFSKFYIPDYADKISGLHNHDEARINEMYNSFGAPDLPDASKEKLRRYVKALLSIEEIESRWCPFKYLTEMPFDKPHNYYDPYNVEHLKMVQKILREQGRITCNNCIKLLNEVPEIRSKNSKSLFVDYLEYLKDIVRGTEDEEIPYKMSQHKIIIAIVIIVIILLVMLVTYAVYQWLTVSPEKMKASIYHQPLQICNTVCGTKS